MRRAEHRASDSDGLLAIPRHLLPSEESADDSEPPGSYREREKREGVKLQLTSLKLKQFKIATIKLYLTKKINS